MKILHKLAAVYLWHNRKPALMFFVFLLVFDVVLFLHRLETAAVLYDALFCACLEPVILAVDFAGFCKRQKLLDELKDRITILL